MFERIVLATDLSPAWDEVVACAGEFKALGCKQVILTYVISVKFMAGMEGSLQATARPKLEAQQQQLEAQGLQVTVETPVGLPADSLNDIACRYGADLIVVGSHGQSLWREGVLGCFTCAVLHNAQYPVLLLNVQIKNAWDSRARVKSPAPRCSATCSCPRTFRQSRPGPWNMWSAWRPKD